MQCDVMHGDDIVTTLLYVNRDLMLSDDIILCAV